MLGSSWSIFILILALVIQSDSYSSALNWLEIIHSGSMLYLRLEMRNSIWINLLTWVSKFVITLYDFWQNFQKDLMALIVASIYLKTLEAGLRMFMYDFFFHNFVFFSYSLQIPICSLLYHVLDLTCRLYAMLCFLGDTFWWICSSTHHWLVGKGNIDS